MQGTNGGSSLLSLFYQLLRLKARRHIQLNAEQRQHLVEITSKGKVAVRLFKRSQILLLSGAGYKDQDIAERVGVQVTTVEPTCQQFVIHGLSEALLEEPRSERQRKLDGKAEAYLVATAGSDAPEGREEWTMQLLAEGLVQLQLVQSISDETARQALKKTRLNRG